MAPYPKHPLVDFQNPCYCPSLPARAYIHDLHQSVLPSAGRFAPLGVVNHFTKVLAQSVATPGPGIGDKGVLDSDFETSSYSSSSSDSGTTTTTDSSSEASGNEEFHSAFSNPQALSNTTATLIGSALPGLSIGTIDRTATTDNISFDLNHLKRFTSLRDSHLLARPPRKRKSSSASNHSGPSGGSDSDSNESDIRGPTKRARSMLDTLERSFKVRLKRKILDFDVPSSTRRLDKATTKSPPPPVLEPYHPSSSSLLLHVDSSTPPPFGVSKKKSDLEEFVEDILDSDPTLSINPDWTIQDIVDYLAEWGLITRPLMKIMGRFPDIRDLNLADSLAHIYDHNPRGIKDILSELHTPGVFMGLISLDIEFVPLDDDDVLYFHQIPGLRHLSLTHTSITNIAVYLLSSHRHSLLTLDISSNERINDDAIVPLLNFKELRYLNLVETSITMGGLRRYAKVVREARPVIHIRIPEGCEHKLQNLGSRYLLDIPSPLISDPEALQNLTLAEIRTNLNAHLQVNNRISTAGNKNELRERLRKLLERRKEDLLVKEMVKNGRCGTAELDDSEDDE